ncbi:response regulator transcription factor [Nocardioides seonyuensis]|uniref:Response regulator transcription factor n=1 Tax=Nocardioides seonyuensis TaxID=2518371 RepID=A0A4P7IDT1_9ACTN|nr:response regulator transcription factor [Nocardioides seonyuensis]QBX55355.1 response regulator transcription factor [Nocardioides seonyuensis]
MGIRLVLAEDGDLLRAGILALLESYEDLEIVATATSLPELLSAVAEHEPDVVLTDIRMPPDFTDEGIRAANQLRQTHPGTGVIALTQYSDVEYALDLVRDGSDGRGYLLKERVAAVDELVAAIRTVAAGGSVIDQLVVDALVATSTRRHDSVLDRLTKRELEVLAMVARGMTNGSIAAALVISERSVEKHINSIFSKLDLPADSPVHRRVAATLVFLSEAGVGGRNRLL